MELHGSESARQHTTLWRTRVGRRIAEFSSRGATDETRTGSSRVWTQATWDKQLKRAVSWINGKSLRTRMHSLMIKITADTWVCTDTPHTELARETTMEYHLFNSTSWVSNSRSVSLSVAPNLKQGRQIQSTRRRTPSYLCVSTCKESTTTRRHSRSPELHPRFKRLTHQCLWGVTTRSDLVIAPTRSLGNQFNSPTNSSQSSKTYRRFIKR